MKNITVSGNGYYTDDSEYVVVVSKATIRRGDGSTMTVPDVEDAHDIAEALVAGNKQDSDYEWTDNH